MLILGSASNFLRSRLIYTSTTLVNLYARADWQDWRFQVNLQNLLDESYVSSASGSFARGVHPGAPFTAIASVSYSF